MTVTVLRGGHVIDPSNGVDAVRDVVIRDGHIAEVVERASIANPDKVLDASKLWVVPGLIDLHTHLREPGQEGKENLESGCRAAVAGGFTSLVAMPNTVPPIDVPALARYIEFRAKEVGMCRVYPSGAITRGQLGQELTDFFALAQAGCVCLTDDGHPVMSAALMRRALQWAFPMKIPLMVHEEDLTLSNGGSMNEGLTAAKLGLKPIPPSAETVMVSRDLLLAEETQGHVHFAHMSCEASVRMIREAKRRGLHVTAEAAPHHFTLTDEAVEHWNTNAKMNPPLRSQRDVEAVREGLADGTLDAIATDHAPHGSGDKECEFDHAANGIIGLETALPLTLELVHTGKLKAVRAVELLTAGPAKVFRLPGGTLSKNAPADVTVIDPNEEWLVDVSKFRSKSKNSPFEGRKMKGRVKMTWVDGKLVFQDSAGKGFS